MDTSVILCLNWVSWELQTSPELNLTPLYTWCLMPPCSNRWLLPLGPWPRYLGCLATTVRLAADISHWTTEKRRIRRSRDIWRHSETAGVIMQWADGAEPGRPCVMSGQPRVAVTESNTPPHKQNYTADSRANCGACQWSSQSPTSDTPSVC